MAGDDLLEQANQFAKEGKYEAALGLFREAGRADGHYGAGACLFKLDRYDEAVEELHHCLELEPQHEKAQSLIDRAQAKQRDSEASRETLAAKKKAKQTQNAVIGCVGCLTVPVILIIVFSIYVGTKREPQRSERDAPPPGMVKRPLGYLAKSDIVPMPVWQKQKIYYDLVGLEDKYDALRTEDGTARAQAEVAAKHKISAEDVEKIAREGVITMWPMPTPLPQRPLPVAVGEEVPLDNLLNGFLDVGAAYRISIPKNRNVPLCPNRGVDTTGMSGEEAITAVAVEIGRMKSIPSGSTISVKQRVKDSSEVWFFVAVTGPANEGLGQEWIRDTALMGTTLVRVR